MAINFDSEENLLGKVVLNRLDTYVAFRYDVPKPPSEDTHLRHILRYYVSRAFLKEEKESVYVLPKISVDGQQVFIDVLAINGEQVTLAICEPESVTQETEEILELVKSEPNVDVIVLHSQFGDSGNVEEKFTAEIEKQKIKIMAVVPPPFDDVYEYDIWMFETTFREIFRG